MLYLICILFLPMNFDHNARPLQQLVDCSDAFSSNEVILYLPLRSVSPAPLHHKLIALGFVEDCHFVQVC